MTGSTADEIRPGDLFVSPRGDDAWSGQQSEPSAAGDDGPFETIERAKQAVRERKDGAESIPNTVWLRGGRYEIAEPLRFGPEDSAPVRYAAYPGEKPVISGGRRIEGWESTTVNGVEMWKTCIPAVRDGDWYFRQLFVNGVRRKRPRLPQEGYYEVHSTPYERDEIWNRDGGVSFTFNVNDAELDRWHRVSDVDVLIPHRWVQERSPVADVDPSTGRIDMELYAKMWLHGGERVAFENVFEALVEPGQWYLDRQTGECYYVPTDDDDLETVEAIAPRTHQLLRVEGNPRNGDWVEFLEFEEITFNHSAWTYPADLDPSLQQDPSHPTHSMEGAATSVQAQYVVPGALSMTAARNCRLAGCTVQHVGFYALQLDRGCRANRVVGNTLRDTGAGGIKLEGAPRAGPDTHKTGDNRITDNEIHAGGRVFPAGVGILARHTFGNELAYNHIHEYFYSGISCGWNWGYEDSIARDNRIEHNHIHDIGQGVLSDMGGIYTLGVQPGTTVRNNLIHDVACYDYGAWAIYPDEGSSHIVIEDNICHSTNREIFHQHYGRENVVRNNVFALGARGQINLSRTDDGHRPGFTFERNIVVTDGEPVFVGGYDCDLDEEDLISDLNILWDRTDGEPVFAANDRDADGDGHIDRDEWQARGFDRHSLVEDPRFVDLPAGELTLEDDSPAEIIGFTPIETSTIGPRQ